MISNEEMQIYLSGKKLYGNDLSLTEIEKWFEDEKEGYSQLLEQGNKFNYDLMNKQHAFNYLPKEKKYNHALSFGGAGGEELLSIVDKINLITISDPSNYFIKKDLQGKPIVRVKPTVEGVLEFENNSIDIITCFGVLHHIPNVSFVISELYRCLKKDGYLLIREPINSMGDWRFPRKLTTKRERGIPLNLFREWITQNNFTLIKETLCEFSVLCRMFGYRSLITSSRTFIFIDKLLSKLFEWNYNYHSHKKTDKVKPLSVYYVLKK